MDRLMGDVKSGLIEIEEVVSLELDQAGDIFLPPGSGQEERYGAHEDYADTSTSSLPRKVPSGRPQPSSIDLLPEATVEAMCARGFADPDVYRLLPGVGALDPSKLTWAAQHRLEIVQMCTVQSAMLLTVPINVGIDGGFEMTPYSRDLLEADLVFNIMENTPTIKPYICPYIRPYIRRYVRRYVRTRESQARELLSHG